MKTWRLKFDDRATMLALFDAAGWMVGGDITLPAGYRLDELGELYKTEPTGDPETGEYTPGVLYDGWFANILDIDEAGLPGDLGTAAVTPSGPAVREFAL